MGKLFGHEIKADALLWTDMTSYLNHNLYGYASYRDSKRVINCNAIVIEIKDVWFFGPDREYITDGRFVYEKVRHHTMPELTPICLEGDVGMPYIEVGIVTPIFNEHGKISFHARRVERKGTRLHKLIHPEDDSPDVLMG